MNTKIYAGSSLPDLALKLSAETQIPLGKISLSRFDNRESRVYIADSPPQTAIVLQSLSVPVDHHFVEMLLIIDALKRLGTGKIVVIIPWLGYSKQDKVFRSGEPLSVKVIANCLQTLPVDQLITLDLHNPAIGGFFDIPIHNCHARPLLIDYCQKNLQVSSAIVVAPDAGAIKNSTQIAETLGIPVAYINKSRNLDSGQVSVVDINRQIKNLDVLLIDDMIATGSTIVSVAKFLKEAGAKSIAVMATHHLQLKGVQATLDASSIDRFIITDSIEVPSNPSTKTVILSCANLLAQTLLPMIK